MQQAWELWQQGRYAQAAATLRREPLSNSNTEVLVRDLNLHLAAALTHVSARRQSEAHTAFERVISISGLN
jgi:hypothetical protein